MNELDQFDYNVDDFSAKTEKTIAGSSRYIKPPKSKTIPERRLKYRFAEELANDIVPEKGMRYFVFLDGSFIAGDFIEAFFVKHNLHAKRLLVSTLSMSQNNVDSLKKPDCRRLCRST